MSAAVVGATLAHRADFRLADATVRPSIRMIDGPVTSVPLEPKVMQVLLAFVDAGQAVLTRDDLAQICWNGRIIGDDAVNRAVAVLRRAIRVSGAAIAIETIPRIGFRLSVSVEGDTSRSPQPDTPILASRRTLTASIAVLGLAIASGALIGRGRWTSPTALPNSPLEQARRALHDGFPDSGQVAARLLDKVVREYPRNAEAWGLLAFAHRDIAESAAPQDVSDAVRKSGEAARRALDIDPRQGDAHAALATLRPYFGDYESGEKRLIAALKFDQVNFLTILHLIPLYQGVGRVRLSEQWNERQIRIDPQSPVPNYRRGIKLWALGQLDAAEQAMDRAVQLWPRHPSVWNARMMMFAYSGRPKAALAQLEHQASRPITLKPAAIELWRVSLHALASPTKGNVAVARAANLAAAPRSPGFANTAMHNLAMLDELDGAFDVAFGYYLRRGSLITAMWEGAGELPVSALRWRRSMALFAPPAARMRADQRFAELLHGMGIVRYWRQAGQGPDPQLGLDWLAWR